MADERSCFLDTNSKTPFAPRLLRLFNQFSVGKVLPLLSSLLARAMANFNLVLFGRWDIVFVPVCVCVCVHPWTGFFHYLVQPPSTSRGQRDLQSWPLPTKLHTGRSGKRTCAVIPLHSSLLCFDAMVVHVSPPKPFPPQQRCSLSRFVTAVKGNNFCSNTYNFLGLFAMLFHRHPSQRGN